jgi:anti-anti-sigma factor
VTLDPPTEIRASPTPDGLRVQLLGEHDLATTDQLAETLAGHSRVIIDLTDCAFIDSTVLGVFVERVNAGVKLILISPSGTPPRRVLDLTQVSTVIDVRDR